MGIFSKKVDAKTLEFLERTEAAELFVRGTIALVVGPLPLYSDFPEGIGTLVLNKDGSGFLWKMKNMQGVPINDEISFDAVQAWGELAKNPKFGFVLRAFSEHHDVYRERPSEEIYFNAGAWSFALSENPQTFGQNTLVSEWIKHHYPKIKFNPPKGGVVVGKKT